MERRVGKHHRSLVFILQSVEQDLRFFFFSSLHTWKMKPLQDKLHRFQRSSKTTLKHTHTHTHNSGLFRWPRNLRVRRSSVPLQLNAWQRVRPARFSLGFYRVTLWIKFELIWLRSYRSPLHDVYLKTTTTKKKKHGSVFENAEKPQLPNSLHWRMISWLEFDFFFFLLLKICLSWSRVIPGSPTRVGCSSECQSGLFVSLRPRSLKQIRPCWDRTAEMLSFCDAILRGKCFPVASISCVFWWLLRIIEFMVQKTVTDEVWGLIAIKKTNKSNYLRASEWQVGTSHILICTCRDTGFGESTMARVFPCGFFETKCVCLNPPWISFLTPGHWRRGSHPAAQFGSYLRSGIISKVSKVRSIAGDWSDEEI